MRGERPAGVPRDVVAVARNGEAPVEITMRARRNGIAERLDHPTDRRRLIVQLTKSGREIVNQTSEWLRYAFKNIEPAELTDVAASLHTIAEDLRNRAVPEPTA
jgi:hypothetical protein